MSAKWPDVPLNELVKPVARPLAVVPGQSYRTIGVKWWGEGAYERATIDGAQTAAKTLSVVRENDLIINKIWVRHGATAIASQAVDGCAASGEFPTFELDRDKVAPGWLHWQTKTRSFWGKCDALSRGTSGKNRIKPELFLTIGVPLPPLAEQRRLVARIEELAAQINEARALRQQAAEEAEALVISTHLGLSKNRTRKLAQIVALDEDAVPVDASGSYPQVGVRSFGGGLFSKTAIRGTDTSYRAFNRLYAGALVLSQVKGWEGAVAVCPDELAGWFVSPEYRTFRCIPSEARPRYLTPLVRTGWFWGRLASATRGVGARRERTRPEQFLDIELPMPDVEQQKQGEILFAQIEALKPLQAETAAELDALLPSILDKAFKGEL